MKILFLPKYDSKGASSRYRIFNYLPFYAKSGILSDVIPFFSPDYIRIVSKPAGYKALYSLKNYLSRMLAMRSLGRYDFYYIGGDLFPYLPYFIEEKFLEKKKYIIDLDDAIFHNYDLNTSALIRILAGNKFGRLFANASHIITGSPYLTACALKFNSNVTEIPTSIDIEKYKVAHYEPAGCLKIGWIGSPTTSKYVLGVLEALRMFTKDHTCELVLIGFDKCLESKLAGLPYRIVEWSEETEVNELCKIDVGIMPLDDTPWSRGKCGFKLIQYMACEKPTISTPLEANVKIDNGNGNLFAMATEEWVECFKKVCLNRDAFRQIGIKNRITVETAYTFQSNYKKYIDVFRTVAENE